MPFGINYCDTHDSALHIKLDTNNGRLKIKNGQRLCTTVTHGRWHGRWKNAETSQKHRSAQSVFCRSLGYEFVSSWQPKIVCIEFFSTAARSFFLRGIFFSTGNFFLQGVFSLLWFYRSNRTFSQNTWKNLGCHRIKMLPNLMLHSSPFSCKRSGWAEQKKWNGKLCRCIKGTRAA